jgi:hypothetical protein
MRWKKEEIEKLKEIYSNEDLNLNQIAEIIGKSRKSICHKASRLQLSRPRRVHNNNPNRKPRGDYDKRYYETHKSRLLFLKKLRFKKLKIKLVNSLGGKCKQCGYDKCISALEFHHLKKDKEGCVCLLISKGFVNRAIAEAKKCKLLCANCHRETHFEIDDKSFQIDASFYLKYTTI